jgi:hypothetical protein
MDFVNCCGRSVSYSGSVARQQSRFDFISKFTGNCQTVSSKSIRSDVLGSRKRFERYTRRLDRSVTRTVKCVWRVICSPQDDFPLFLERVRPTFSALSVRRLSCVGSNSRPVPSAIAAIAALAVVPGQHGHRQFTAVRSVAKVAASTSRSVAQFARTGVRVGSTFGHHSSDCGSQSTLLSQLTGSNGSAVAAVRGSESSADTR